MKIIITENQYKLLLESELADSKSVMQKLIGGGIPKKSITELKLSYENTWVIKVVCENFDTIAISYPVLIDEIPSNDKTKVTVNINGKEKTMSIPDSINLVSLEYKKRKLPRSH